MKGYEYAKANDMSNDEVKEKFGLKSHLSVIPEDLLFVEADTDTAPLGFDDNDEEVIEEVIKEAPAVAKKAIVDDVQAVKDALKDSQTVMKMLMKDGITAKQALVGLNMVANKSPYWEYKRVLETLVED